MKTYQTFLLAIAFAAFPLLSLAATPINQTRALNADGEIKVENISGLIKVRVWNEAKVQITGSLGEGAEKLVIEGDARSLHIKVKYPERKGGWFNWGNSAEAAAVLKVRTDKFAALDTDKNASVSKAEFFVDAKAKLAAADTDKDGKVTPWEFRAQN